MPWPQLGYLAINLLAVGVVLAKHGQPQTGKYNVFATLAGWSISLGFLYWGGFFG